MTQRQKKLVEGWMALGVLLSVVIIFRDASWNVQWAFIPFVLYYLFNWSFFHDLQPLNKQFLAKSLQRKKNKLWVFASCSILIVLALASLLSGFNPFDYFGIGSLLSLAVLPILPALVSSQAALYRELGK